MTTGVLEEKRSGRIVLLRTVIAVTLGFLFLQFLTGMWVNLFVNFPNVSTSQGYFGMGAMMSFMYSGGAVFVVHMMTGYFIGFLSIIVLVVSLLSHRLAMIALGVVGLASVLFAGINGLVFMFSGFTNNANSYLMALGFVTTFAIYFLQFYYSGKNVVNRSL
ncbi:MAG: hypothetical protein JRN06_12975 [Nitrososphaerota archaeon]|nr:hypothetical protein [Nitrososphaerota archaeon]